MNELEQYIDEVKEWCEEVLGYVTELDFNDEIRYIVYRIHLLLGRLDYRTQDMWELISIFSEEVETIEHLVMEEQQKRSLEKNVVPLGKHILPPLPYPYDGLEPYIQREIMYLHHDKHHRSYVEGLNKAEQMLQEIRQSGDFLYIKHWERELAFHGSGHYLHSIFWRNMIPGGGGEPTGELKVVIEREFGSYPLFKAHFSQAGSKVEGSGWVLLVYSRQSQKLEILQSEKHQNLTQWDSIPLLVLDVWEHAYYLQYKNMRDEYIRNWWNVVNWANVEERYLQAVGRGKDA